MLKWKDHLEASHRTIADVIRVLGTSIKALFKNRYQSDVLAAFVSHRRADAGKADPAVRDRWQSVITARVCLARE